MGEILAFVTSPGFVAGIFSSLIGAILAYLVKPTLDRFRKERHRRRIHALQERQRIRALRVHEARESERVLLSHALREIRARLRAQTWLVLSLFLSSLSAFVLFFYIEIESALTVPTLLSLGLVALMMGSIMLFVFSLADERSASRDSDIVVEVLKDEGDVTDRTSYPSSDFPWNPGSEAFPSSHRQAAEVVQEPCLDDEDWLER